MNDRSRATVLTVALIFVTSLFSYYAGAIGLFPELTRPFTSRFNVNLPVPATGAEAQLFDQVRRHVERNFVDPLPSEQILEGGLKGLMESTGDKYSTYFPPEAYKTFLSHFEPTEFGGIGVHVQLSAQTGLITVVSPIRGSPGDEAGLMPGDSIMKVDGTDIKGFAVEQAVNLIRGPEGSPVRLTVQREGTAQSMEFVITRARIVVPAVTSRMLDRSAGVGYLQIIEFKRQTTEDVQTALTELRRDGMTRLVLDLRQNPGGLLDVVIEVASIFVPSGQPVVHIVDREGERQTYNATPQESFNVPMVVLVDSFSASASEILAGAIKDHGLGLLVGTTTFGKGSVQSFFDLPNGGGIKLTTSRYLTSGGHSINEQGIEPDRKVENPKDVRIGDPNDVQLEAAIRLVKQQ